MKISLEPMELSETEVIIRGDITGKEASAVLKFLKVQNNSTGKLFLYKEEEQFLIDPKDVIFIEVAGSRVNVVTKSGTFQSKQKLYELKEQLDLLPFAQINKSTIVNIDYALSVSAEFSGNYTLRLKERKDTLIISRKYFKEFKNKI